MQKGRTAEARDATNLKGKTWSGAPGAAGAVASRKRAAPFEGAPRGRRRDDRTCRHWQGAISKAVATFRPFSRNRRASDFAR